MSVVTVSHLTFGYDGSAENIFEDVSFQFDTDWKLGFTGHNGRGKTTFLNLLMGKYEYRGAISASVTFDYFPYAVADGKLPVLDVITAVAPGREAWEIERELGLLTLGGETLGRPFQTLSGGEQTRALLAALFLKGGHFPLIDEPTNHLDMEARDVLAAYLKRKSGFLLVSHDRAFLDGTVDHILSINRTDIEIQQGNFSSWWAQKRQRDASELAQNERLEREIGRLKKSAVRTAQWSEKVEKSKHQPLKSGLSADKGYIGHKAAKMMKRSKATEKRRQDAVEERSKLLKNIEEAEDLKIHPLRYHAPRLLSLERVAVSYGGREIFPELSFTLEQGDRLALLGGNGSGKSSLLKLICGEDIPHSGQVRPGSRLILSYVPQDTSSLAGGLDGYAREQQIDGTLFKTILRKLDFSRVQFEKDMRELSAGQKKKVLIARSLCQRAHLYLWDEPLNYVDVLSRMQIEALLTAYAPTMIFTEHDRAFVDAAATKRLTLAR